MNNLFHPSPSKYEGFGLTILEGLHSRLATITLDESPMNEIVSNNINGYCMPTIKVGNIRNQTIFDVEELVFLKYFRKLIQNNIVYRILF